MVGEGYHHLCVSNTFVATNVYWKRLDLFLVSCNKHLSIALPILKGGCKIFNIYVKCKLFDDRKSIQW